MRSRPWAASAVVVALVGGVLSVGPPPASASCVGPQLGVGPAIDDASPPSSDEVLTPGEVFTVSGVWFRSGCADSLAAGPGCGAQGEPTDPEAPLTGVPLVLRQGGRTWVLDTQDASERFTIRWSAQLPAGVTPGRAELAAESASLSVTIAR